MPKQNLPSGAYPTGIQLRTQHQLVNDQLLAGLLEVIPQTTSVIDIGAGVGHYLKALREHGYSGKLIGVDGSPQIDRLSDGLVQELDITKPADCVPYFGSAQWGLFIEVGEHISPIYEQVVINNVSKIPEGYLVITWAIPNQRGRGHVNCRTPFYVASQFSKRNWGVDEEMTVRAHQAIGGRRTPDRGKLKDKLMVLRKGAA